METSFWHGQNRFELVIEWGRKISKKVKVFINSNKYANTAGEFLCTIWIDDIGEFCVIYACYGVEKAKEQFGHECNDVK